MYESGEKGIEEPPRTSEEEGRGLTDFRVTARTSGLTDPPLLEVGLCSIGRGDVRRG